MAKSGALAPPTEGAPRFICTLEIFVVVALGDFHSLRVRGSADVRCFLHADLIGQPRFAQSLEIFVGIDPAADADVEGRTIAKRVP